MGKFVEKGQFSSNKHPENYWLLLLKFNSFL